MFQKSATVCSSGNWVAMNAALRSKLCRHQYNNAVDGSTENSRRENATGRKLREKLLRKAKQTFYSGGKLNFQESQTVTRHTYNIVVRTSLSIVHIAYKKEK